MIFRSDNTAGVAPSVLAELAKVNAGYVSSYGSDVITAEVERRLSELFEKRVHLLMCTSGTAANSIALGAVTPSFGHCYCHELAHIRVDECNAVPMVTGGANLWAVAGEHAKIDPDALRTAINFPDGSVHMGKPSSLGITQATERGCIYTLDEIDALTGIAKSKDLKVHLDGARFANALVALGCTPAEMTWQRGVDLVTFGSAKNGTFSAEALIIFDEQIAQTAAYLHKRMAQMSSKMRFQSAQMLAYLQNDLWLDNARRANATARYLAGRIEASGVGRLDHPVEANMLFWRVPNAIDEHFKAAGHHLTHDDWGDERTLRLVCAFDVQTSDVDKFMAETVETLPQPLRQAS